jgi:hypothetical protein
MEVFTGVDWLTTLINDLMEHERFGAQTVLKYFNVCQLIKESESKLLIGDQPHSKLATFSYLIRRELFLRNFCLPSN